MTRQPQRRLPVCAAALLCAALAVVGCSAARSEQMSYLDNGKVRLGLDLSIGGAVTYLSGGGESRNMINSADWGRQVQLSFYSGPNPFVPPGATVSKAWEGLGWNPIQAGDCYHNGSKVVEHRNDGKTITVKCIPMIWPLKNVPGECTFECTYRLVDTAVEVTCRLNNARSDHTQYSGRGQELPAVYTNGPWYKLVTYLGDRPFTGAPTTTLVDKDDGKGWPWLSFYATEQWAALLDEHDRGVGVYTPGAYRFGGGFAGAPKGSGGQKDGQTGYIAPTMDEILDHNIVYEYRYVLIPGTLSQIRQYVYAHAQRPSPPKWEFAKDRQHWVYENTTDAGWPIAGDVNVKLGAKGAAMVSPPTFWRAEDAKQLDITGSFRTEARELAVSIEPFTDQERRDWPCWGAGSQRPPKPMVGPIKVPITGDGAVRTYRVPLAGVTGYQGTMVRLRLLLPEGQGTAQIRRLALVR